ncbi:glycine/sarcosine/betaine reductase complex component C subunit beta [Syntrophomonas erecta]
MSFPVIRAASYILVHAPNIMLEHGTTLTMERMKNPESDYLKALPTQVRSFAEAVNYPPNQVYIGNIGVNQLAQLSSPWYKNGVDGNKQGRFGEIVEESEFYGVMKIVDSFNLVELTGEFAAAIKEKLTQGNMFNEKQLSMLDKFREAAEVKNLVASGRAEGFYLDGELVGCVREAHETDPNLAAHVVFENLVSKASAVIALKNLLLKNNLSGSEIDYIIETSEEAIGDMNQRGGGNLAKAIGEIGGCDNATGVDMRAFCAGPAHGILNAAALVQAGIFKNVAVLAGGSSAKLGMNSRDHVNKGMPVLEDVVGGYALLISENDGHSPVIRTDILGKHKISSGSSPQAVIQAIVVDPLEKNNLKITDIDVYAPELQNPEITVPAGAGDVPLANYKMIGAMAVKRGEIAKTDLVDFTQKHGVIGFAPTQGHIPSGVPLVGHIMEMMQAGEIQRAMIIGKGSLFLGRMTDLFDGVSFIIEKNAGTAVQAEPVWDDEVKQQIRNMIAEALEDAAEKLGRR